MGRYAGIREWLAVRGGRFLANSMVDRPSVGSPFANRQMFRLLLEYSRLLADDRDGWSYHVSGMQYPLRLAEASLGDA